MNAAVGAGEDADVVIGHRDSRHQRPLRHVAGQASGARAYRTDRLPGLRVLVRAVTGQAGTLVGGGASVHIPVGLVAGDAGETVATPEEARALHETVRLE